MAEQLDNLRIWRKLFITDPQYVKEGTGKPYKYHTVDSYHQVLQATQQWGPCGIGWGFEVKHEIISSPETTELLAVANVVFWFRDGDLIARIPATACCKLVMNPKSGPHKIDTDAIKKATTDALTKAMSYTGMAGDLFHGHYDQPQWRAQATAEFAKRKADKRKAAEQEAEAEPGREAGPAPEPGQPDPPVPTQTGEPAWPQDGQANAPQAAKPDEPAPRPLTPEEQEVSDRLGQYVAPENTEHVEPVIGPAEFTPEALVSIRGEIAAGAKRLPPPQKVEARRLYGEAGTNPAKLRELLRWVDQKLRSEAKQQGGATQADDAESARTKQSEPPTRSRRGEFRKPVADG